MAAPLVFDVLASALAGLLRALLVTAGLVQPPYAPPATEAELTLSGPLVHVGRIDGAPYDHLGWTVATLEDLDDDGAREIVVGVRPWVPGLTSGIGRVVVHSGRTRAQLWERSGGGSLDDPDDPFGFRVDGFGQSFAMPGDLTGDGKPDLLVGGGDSIYGAYVLLLSGVDGAVVQTWEGAPGGSCAPITVGDLDGDGRSEFGVVSSGFLVRGSTELFSGRDRSALRQLPFALIGRIGDVDGDGAPDFLQEGEGFGLVRGPDAGAPDEHAGSARRAGEWMHLSSRPRAARGREYLQCLSGDHDGDGCRDLVSVTYVEGRLGNRSPAQEADFDLCITSGRDGKLIMERRITLDPPGALGFVGSAGDLDGDGKDELVIVRSGEGARLDVHSSAADWAVFASATSRSSSFGGAVVNAGDLDGDGLPELVIGDLEHTGGGTCAGAVHVLSWRPERK